jgi:hypothetical protein
VLLHQAVSTGAVTHGADAGGTVRKAAGTEETGLGRSVGVGKCGQCHNGARTRPGESAALSAGAVAVSVALSGGRQAGAEQQPCRAQPKALCDGPEEWALATRRPAPGPAL